MPDIIIDHDEEYNAIVSVEGVIGPSCKDLTREIEKKLGRVSSFEMTPEAQQDERVRAYGHVDSRQRRG